MCKEERFPFNWKLPFIQEREKVDQKCYHGTEQRETKKQIIPSCQGTPGEVVVWLKETIKTEQVSNECTHHQYAQHIYEKGEKEGLVISMVDKAYLRPGTDVGMRCQNYENL